MLTEHQLPTYRVAAVEASVTDPTLPPGLVTLRLEAYWQAQIPGGYPFQGVMKTVDRRELEGAEGERGDPPPPDGGDGSGL